MVTLLIHYDADAITIVGHYKAAANIAITRDRQHALVRRACRIPFATPRLSRHAVNSTPSRLRVCRRHTRHAIP